MGNPESFNPLKTEESYGLIPKLGSAEINGRPMESPNVAGNLEAVDELATILESIEDRTHRQRLEAIFKGLINGRSDEEILDELERVEGKRINRPRLRSVYRYCRKKYLRGKFPNIPATLGELREFVRGKATERSEEKRKKHLAQLSDELIRLAGEKQTEQIKLEQLIIEYLLSGGSREYLANAGLRTDEEILKVKEAVLNRLGIPLGFKKQRIVGLSRI
ncbi:MAG: hypothetical protein HZC26_01375 [Candidatus Magasanikbacteria bacterium]|nr:hypothetical protein [Candidatus Magasanikbacteria bacterium]